MDGDHIATQVKIAMIRQLATLAWEPRLNWAMRMLRFTSPLGILVALGACTSVPHPSRPASVLHCENGETVEVGYAGNVAIVRYKNRRHEMAVAMSASGARYIGDGMQWWTRGFGEGMIAPLPPGQSITNEGLVTCRAGPPPGGPLSGE